MSEPEDTHHLHLEGEQYPALRLRTGRTHTIIVHLPRGEYTVHTDITEQDFDELNFSAAFRLTSSQGYLQEKELLRGQDTVTFEELPMGHRYTLEVSMSKQPFEELLRDIPYAELSTSHQIPDESLLDPARFLKEVVHYFRTLTGRH